MRIDLKWLVIAAAVLILVIVLGFRFLGNQSAQTRQAEAGQLGAEAMQEAGAAAVTTVIDQADEEMEIADLVNRASKEIDNAPNPTAARAATLDAACQLRIYRDDPACTVREPDPTKVD